MKKLLIAVLVLVSTYAIIVGSLVFTGEPVAIAFIMFPIFAILALFSAILDNIGLVILAVTVIIVIRIMWPKKVASI